MASPAPSSISSFSSASNQDANTSVVTATTAIGTPKSTAGQISSIILPSMLVPYIWPTSPASFCTGVVVGLLVGVLRPIIEHYVDVGASYIAIGLRFSLIWGSVALIAWAVLRVLQQTSAATLVINPQQQPADQQPQAQQHQHQQPHQPHQHELVAPNMLHHDMYAGEYILDQPRARYGPTAQYGAIGSSAESIYSATTSSSGSSGSASSLYYSPPTPQYNPYSAPSSGANSPVRANSPTRMSPIRKSVPGGPSGGATSPLGKTSAVRRMEPRIVPLDDTGADEGAYRPYPSRTDVGAAYRAKTGTESISVLEKPIGQGAFRMQRKA